MEKYKRFGKTANKWKVLKDLLLYLGWFQPLDMSKKAKPAQPRSKITSNKIKPPILKKSTKKIDYFLVALGIIIVCISFIRLKLIDIPLERDEGEYAYFGKLILDGIAPYKQAYNMKLPGTYGMYALVIGIFGKNISSIHYGLLLINVATILFLFFGFRRMFNSSIAFFAASVFAIMSVSPSVLGFAAHATHFVTFFVSIGIFFLSRFYENRKLLTAFWVGLMFGLSFLMKQQAVFFIVFGGLAIILAGTLEKPLKLKPVFLEASVYSAGAITPYLVTVLILKAAGAFDNFWFWTVQYASKYAAGVPFKEGKELFAFSFNPMWHEFTFFWIIFFAGMVLTFLTKFSLRQKLIAISFAVFAFLTVCPGFFFRSHYFVSFLPAIGLMGGISIDYISSLLSRSLRIKSLNFLSAIVFFIVLISVISKNKDYYLNPEPNEISRIMYGSNPFVEAPEIANYIKENSAATDKIAVLGSEPEIFFYADRHSATGYIYTYGLMEIHDYNKKMQQEMIAEIEKNKPKFIVFCDIATSWLTRPNSPMLIFDWFNKYSDANYELTGVADIVSGYQTIYKWNDEAKTYQPKGKQKVLVFKRK